MRLILKKLVIIILVTFVLFLFFKKRKTNQTAFDFGKTYSIERKSDIDSLTKYLFNKKLIPNDADEVFINYHTRRNDSIIITTSTNDVYEKNEPTPYFIKNLYVDNLGLLIQVEKDGINLVNLYRYGFKFFNYKYFFDKHNLYGKQASKNGYVITTPDKAISHEKVCCIIDDHWIMLCQRR